MTRQSSANLPLAMQESVSHLSAKFTLHFNLIINLYAYLP